MRTIISFFVLFEFLISCMVMNIYICGCGSLRRFLSTILAVVFIVTTVSPAPVNAQMISGMTLPLPDVMLSKSPAYFPAMLKGITFDRNNPLHFRFIVNVGDSGLKGKAMADESRKLIRYFMAGLTTPEKDLWVNLSPYEKDRIIPDSFGVTEMGRDLLGQDYILKQLTSSLMYPEQALGQKFWDRVHAKARELYGTSDIPLNTFNKVWIVPQKAALYEHDGSVFVVKTHLKVMLEEDYAALQKSLEYNPDLGQPLVQGGAAADRATVKVVSGLTSEVVREVLIPELEQEVNTGRNFAGLRQIYNSMVLAIWYKQNLRATLLGQVYVDQNKTAGVDVADRDARFRIFDRYEEAFRKGVYNYIKEESDPVSGETVPRKYFSGGFAPVDWSRVITMLKATPEGIKYIRQELNAGYSGADLAVDTTLVELGPDARPDMAEPTVAGSTGLNEAEGGQTTEQYDAAMLAAFKGLSPSRLFSALFLAMLPLGVLGADSSSPLIAWMRHNVFSGSGMPRSFQVPENPRLRQKFWEQIGDDGIDGMTERIIINNGISVYDAAVWQISLALAGGQDNLRAADVVTATLSANRLGEWNNIRAFKPPFRYQGKELPQADAYFFRIISPDWKQQDPKTGKTRFPGWGAYSGDPDMMVWNDLKPVTGENAWGPQIGPLQTAHIKFKGKVPETSAEVQLAKSVIPAFRALTTPIGAILYAPEGTDDARPGDISNENNISVYAALRALKQTTGRSDYDQMMKGIEGYFRKYAYDRSSHTFYQGGFYVDGKFTPNRDHFALDVQTWFQLVFSPAVMDEWYGQGEAFRNWQASKERAGFYRDGKLAGFGFTDGHDVQSGEWSYGGVAAALELAVYYKKSHPAWSREALTDVISILEGQEALKKTDEQGRASYLYANKRYDVPFGWWANPVPSMASTGWAYFIQNGFNPVKLGGKTTWFAEFPEFKQAVDRIVQATGQASISTSAAEPVSVGRESNSVSSGQDLWSQGVPGEYQDSRWQAKASYVDLSPSVQMKAGQKLSISYSLTGSDVMGIQLIRDGQSEDDRGDMIVRQGVEGTDRTLELTVPSTRAIRRVTFQYGPNADGHLGGSMTASLTVKSVILSDGVPDTRSTLSDGKTPVKSASTAAGIDIWSAGRPGEQRNDQWKSAARYADFDPMIRLKAGQILRLEYDLVGSETLGIQLVGEHESELDRGDMIVMQNTGGSNRIISIKVRRDIKMRRLIFQHGENAWGSLPENSSTSRMTVYSVRVVDPAMQQDLAGPVDNATNVGGINLDPAMLDLQIERDGRGIPLPMSEQDPVKMNIQGFMPVINGVTVMPDLLFSLGMNDSHWPVLPAANPVFAGFNWMDKRDVWFMNNGVAV